MTDLQASLMIIGGTIVVGVISYNKWQEYKARKSVQKAFSSDQDDVLMGEEAPLSAARAEPSFDEGGVAPEADETAATLPESAPAPAVAKELPIDELIDCAIALMLETPARGEKILPHLQSLRHAGNKPVHFVGQRDDGSWEEIATGGIYYGLYAGVQLANRSGALNELEYSELITQLRQMCDQIDAEPDVPDMAEVMERARALHQFVAEYDAQLSISVRSKGAPWAINTLLAALERHGFDVRPDGRLVMPDGDGGVLFSLSTNVTLAEETTPRLTLLLDVPRVAPLRDGYGAMTACARMLANRLDGEVVDDGNQPLQDAALTEIAEQVNAFYSNMEAAGVPAGSTRATRLFA
ncbi:MAG TPA: cell division protein ZipA C-terminal FtsZ-binding domain-containing protein [Noviherbaspirillum sp.]